MAIYHCSTKTVNRSSGRTAVASSAYRAGEKLEDERTGLTHDFTRKDGVAHSEIISNLDIEIDRGELWNLAEKTENRKDARTAREWVIALPDELDADQRKDLAKDFARSLVDRYEVIADLAIHKPSKGGNDKNHHAHIMLTTRKAQLEKLKQLKAQKQAIEARERTKQKEQQRKDDTRRKILLGSYLIKKMQNEANKEKILAELNEYLTENRDRQLFDLPDIEA